MKIIKEIFKILKNIIKKIQKVLMIQIMKKKNQKKVINQI